jgi:hypothetical protein
MSRCGTMSGGGTLAPRWIEGEADDTIVVDDTHFPVIIATWMGSPTPSAVRGYFAWLDDMLARAKRERTILVNVTDSTLAGMPSADVRRLVADLTKAWGRQGADGLVSAHVVVDNALIRGVLRALAWLHGDMRTIQHATCEQALEASIDTLRASGLVPPASLVPSAWRRPSRVARTARRPPPASLR